MYTIMHYIQQIRRGKFTEANSPRREIISPRSESLRSSPDLNNDVHSDRVMNEDKDMAEKPSHHDLISMRNKAAAIIVLSNFALESKTWSEFCTKAASAIATVERRFEPEHNEVLRGMCWNIGDPTSSDIPDQLKQYFKDHYEDYPDHKTQSA